MIINKEKKYIKNLIPFCAVIFLQKCVINSNLNQPKSNDYYTVEKDTISDEFVVNEEVNSVKLVPSSVVKLPTALLPLLETLT